LIKGAAYSILEIPTAKVVRWEGWGLLKNEKVTVSCIFGALKKINANFSTIF
jgi:hypothetical protein